MSFNFGLASIFAIEIAKPNLGKLSQAVRDLGYLGSDLGKLIGYGEAEIVVPKESPSLFIEQGEKRMRCSLQSLFSVKYSSPPLRAVFHLVDAEALPIEGTWSDFQAVVKALGIEIAEEDGFCGRLVDSRDLRSIYMPNPPQNLAKTEEILAHVLGAVHDAFPHRLAMYVRAK